jgi:N-acetylglucosamine kinase-like BadF-type ATPase
MVHAIGVDGGATNTRAVCVRMDGAVLGIATGGPSNYLRVGLAEAASNIQRTAAQATAIAGKALPAAAACIGLAGVGRPWDRALVAPALEALGLAEKTMLCTDADAALVGAHGLAPGVVVIAGTGAMALGQDAKGQTARTDGWGPLLGDGGSAYWIGHRVLRAVMRARDQRGETTGLTGLVLAHLGVRSEEELVRRLPTGEDHTETVARLAQICSALAEEGDDVARNIIAGAGSQLVSAASAVTSALRLRGDVPVALVGSVGQDDAVRRAFADQMARAVPGSRLVESRMSPVRGAALLALRLAGVPADEDVLRRLAEGSAEV